MFLLLTGLWGSVRVTTEFVVPSLAEALIVQFLSFDHTVISGVLLVPLCSQEPPQKKEEIALYACPDLYFTTKCHSDSFRFNLQQVNSSHVKKEKANGMRLTTIWTATAKGLNNWVRVQFWTFNQFAFFSVLTLLSWTIFRWTDHLNSFTMQQNVQKVRILSLCLYRLYAVLIVLHVSQCETVSEQRVPANSLPSIIMGAESNSGKGDTQALDSANYLRMALDFRTESDLLLLYSLFLLHAKIQFIIAVVFLLSLSSVTFPSKTVTLIIHQSPFPALIFHTAC